MGVASPAQGEHFGLGRFINKDFDPGSGIGLGLVIDQQWSNGEFFVHGQLTV